MVFRTAKLPITNSFFLFGPRQTGKSSLIRSSFKPGEFLYINLLKNQEYHRLRADPALLARDVQSREERQRVVVIDEVQRLPELLDEVHNILESPNPPIFGLTGSSARKLRRSHANLLGGRAWTIELFPFTAAELGEKFDLHRALTLGTLPPVYLDSTNEGAANTLSAYVNTYLREEIEAEAVTRSLGTFLKFLPLAAESVGQELNFSKIARVCASNHTTIKNYYKILEDTLLGRFIFPVGGSTRRQLSKSPKFYLFDNGVARAMLGRERSDVRVGTYEYGKLFESWIINEVNRINSYHRKNLTLNFFRTGAGAEVDLVLTAPNGERVGVEIKSAIDVNPDQLIRGFRELEKEGKLKRRICVTQGLRPAAIDGIEHLPWKEFLEWVRSW